MLRRFKCLAQVFWRGQNGNAGVTFAIAAVPLLAGAGAGIDAVRWNGALTHLHVTLDTAVIAGTNALFESGGNEAVALQVANDFFTKNVDNSYQFSKLSVSFKINSNKNGVSAFGDVDMETTFLPAVGISSLPLIASNQGEAAAAIGSPPGGSEKTEVTMMLDVTGSMCSDGAGPCSNDPKIASLKAAASNLVDKLLPLGQTATTARVAIVPFSTRVRVGPDGGGAAMMKSLTNLNANWSGFYNVCKASTGGGGSETSGNWSCGNYQVEPQTNWKVMPCVTDRYHDATGFDVTDDAPGPGKWLNAHDGSRRPVAADSSDMSVTSGTGATTTDPASFWNYDSGGYCADVAEGNQIQPLSSDNATLKSKVNGLEAYGATAGVLGTAFAWYTLSPAWANVWGPSSAADPYADLTAIGTSGTVKLRKIALLMTDGGYNTYRGWKGQDVATLGATAKSLCQGMKNSGIEVFTVGFDFGSLTSSEAAYAIDTLQNCATDAAHFINANSSSDLIAAFDGIAKELTAANVRLTK